MSASTFESTATIELDEPMQERGFSHGQVGLGADGSRSVLYCIPVDVLAGRWPDVHAYLRQRMGVEVCADLTLEVAADGTWNRADLEGIGLADVVTALLNESGLDLDVARLSTMGHDDAIARIRRSIEQLLPAEPPVVGR